MRILTETAHRPWPLPASPWIMRQRWHNLLFAHWPVDRNALRRLVPAAFDLEVFDGTAWVGVVPFTMSDVAPRGVPALPWLSAFPELNVRTYVRVGDRPGIFFFSLDAARWLAVHAARWTLNLPYYTASMHASRRGDRIEYDSRRWRGSADLRMTYAPSGSTFVSVPGTLEYFLTERYCLYQIDRRGRPYRLEIHHPPWSLRLAGAEFVRNTMAAASGITLPETAPLLHFAERQDMVGWAPVPIGRVDV